MPENNVSLPYKKILVTGGTGFLGSYIIKQLIEAGYHVKAIYRNKKNIFWVDDKILEKVEWIEGDVLDIVSLEEAMQDVDAVIHAAAVVSFLKSDRKQMYQTNIEGTTNVVNMMLEKNINRLVYISSVAALGRTVGGAHVTEETKWQESKINTHYAITKHKAEMQVWRGMAEGLQAVILNPSTILGFGDWHSGSSAIFKRLYSGFKWYTSGYNGFVDVTDVARATVLLLQSNISDQRFIVNGHTWPFRKLQDAIADGFGKPRPSKEATPFLLSIAWRMEKIKSWFSKQKPFLTKESAKVGVSKTFFENEKILKTLPGFTFTPLEETIDKACMRYLENVSKK